MSPRPAPLRGAAGAATFYESLIVESRKDREKAESRAGAVFERLKREFGVTLSAISFGLPEFAAGYRNGKSFFQTVVKEGETVTGKELSEVVSG